jgi:putative intracellular protease/amidase
MSQKIAIIVTNTAQYKNWDRKTGLWLGEVTHFCDELEAKGLGFDLISPLGGVCPLDPKSLSNDKTDALFLARPEFVSALEKTHAAPSVNAKDYAAIYYSGGHGTMWDFPDDKALQDLTTAIHADGGIVAAVCHGVSGLLNTRDADGKSLLSGRRVTGFSNLEEGLVRLKSRVPFLLEDELRKRTHLYQRSLLPFVSHVVESERVLTGQNPASARKLGKLIATRLTSA